ncbi:MAG: 3-dehydroquinate synthase [Clostridiales bacterium]|nr:3-dehydroquinate synthase [Clostridiales bacterium]
MSNVYVKTKHRSYYIHIEERDWKPFIIYLKESLKSNRLLIVCDDNVHKLYYQSIDIMLSEAKFDHDVVVVPHGEATKSIKWAEKLYTKAIDNRLDRQSTIVALGGGVVGDLSGFIAATYMRGIGFVQVPTTLLAQIDSSVGGKVAINHLMAKNIVGSFYQPSMVYINISTLETLSEREFLSGLAELIKYGFIWDYEFLNWMDDNIDKILARDIEALKNAIAKACKIKAHIVSIDETEQGIRAILNFGHTIGHAIEAATNYKIYTHGEAIAIGMIYETKLAYNLGLINRQYLDNMIFLFKRCSLPTDLKDVDTSLLMDKMSLDKKNKGGDIVFVLPVDAGEVEIFSNIDKDILEKTLAKGCE